MNKLLRKLAATFLGFAMAAGVGVAVFAGSKDASAVSAADATMTGLTEAGSATVNGKTAVKCGTSKKAGSMKVTVPASSTSMSVYIAGWNGDSSSVSISISNGSISPNNNLSLTSDSGIANNSPFTLSGSESSYLNEFTLSNVTASSDITFSATKASKCRFVVWGATYGTGGGGDTPISYTTDVTGVTGGVLSQTNTSTSFTSSQTSGDVYLTPSSGYTIPSNLSSAFTIDSGTATISSITEYNGDVKISLTGVGSNFSITGSFDVESSSGDYELITDEQSDWSGTYLIANVENSTAHVWTGIDAAGCNVSTTISNGTIGKPNGAQTVTIEAVTGGYTIMVDGGTNEGQYMYGATGSGGSLSFSSSAQVHTISYSSSSVSLGINSKTLRYNSGRFRYYASGQQPIQLFKLVETSNDTTSALSVTPNTWSGYNSDTISLNNYVVSCTTSASDDGYVFQGIGSGAGDNFVGRDADKTSFTPRTTDTRLQWKAKYPQTAGSDDYLYAYVSLTVQADTVSSVTASVNSGTYYAGSKLVSTDFTVSAVWSHAGNKSVTSDFTWTVNGDTDGDLQAGSNTVVVTYNGVNSSNITVTAQYQKGTDVSVPLGVVETINGYSTYSGKQYYVEGYIREWHETQGGALYAFITDAKDTATGSNATRIEIYGTLNFVSGNQDQYVVGSKITAFGTIAEYSGKKEVTNYNSKIDIWVTEVESPSSLTIKTQPSTTTYSVGGYFDPDGLVVTVNYPSRTVDVEYNSGTSSGFSFSPSLNTALTASDTSIQVTYLGVSNSVAITIDSAVHTNSVTLKMGGNNAPDSLTRALDAGDIQFTATLDPAESEDAVTWESSDENLAVVLDGEVTFGNATGVVTITATSGGKSDYIEITLTDPSDAYLFSISIVEGTGVVKDYYNDTILDTTGLSVTATYKSTNVSGWSKDVANFTTNIEWSLDRINGYVVARYNNSETIYDLMEVTIHNSDKPLSFIIAYSGATVASTDTSYDLGEYITLPSGWSATATKNTPQNNIGLNQSGQIKLYSDKTNGTGNELTVESTDSAVIVKTVTLTLSGTCSHEVRKTGDVVVSGTNEVYQINASSFTIQNTHTGSSTSTLSIISIEVSYGYVDSFVAAQTFENDYIKRDIAYPEQSGPTGVPGVACLPDDGDEQLGYFDLALAAYNNMSDSQSRFWFASRTEFAKARERFQAWATANGKTLIFDTTTGEATVSQGAKLFGSLFNESSNKVAIIVIISMVSMTAIGGYFFLRKRKEN